MSSKGHRGVSTRFIELLVRCHRCHLEIPRLTIICQELVESIDCFCSDDVGLMMVGVVNWTVTVRGEYWRVVDVGIGIKQAIEVVPAFWREIIVVNSVLVHKLSNVLRVVSGFSEPVRKVVSIFAAQPKLVISSSRRVHIGIVSVMCMLATQERHTRWTAKSNSSIVVLKCEACPRQNLGLAVASGHLKTGKCLLTLVYDARPNGG